MLKEFYDQIGGDYNDVMLKIQNEDIIRKFILRFKEDESYINGKKALEANDIKTAFLCVHTLKGIAVNLGFSRLGNAASDLTEALRNSDTMPDDRLADLVEKEYKAVISAIDTIIK